MDEPELAGALAAAARGDLAGAEAVLSRLALSVPDNPEILLPLANARRDLGLYELAIESYAAILKLDPDHVAITGLALTHFYRGDFAKAWPAFESRYRLMETPPSLFRTKPDGTKEPLVAWRGRSKPKRLVVMGEQGKGDTIQFCRFLPGLVEAGTEVVLITNQSLFALIGTLAQPVTFLPLETPRPVGSFDAWIPLMSLPLALNLTPERFAPSMPYLKADSERVAAQKKRLGDHGFRVGISWRGNPAHSADKARSIPLRLFAPLAAIPGVRLISLQKGADAEISTAPFQEAIEPLPEDFDAGDNAFLDTAALMECLDLVVSVDTAIAHLAGALNRPLHLLLMKHGVDWRWGARGETSAWYPSARLFRQQAHGQWREVIDRVAVAIAAAAAARSRTLEAPVSAGELLDKLTILDIKSERVSDAGKLVNIRAEQAALRSVRDRAGFDLAHLAPLISQLRTTNEALWDIEDEIRECEAKGSFGKRFVTLARSVYTTNDQRARLKREINAMTGSQWIEEKSYKGL